MGMYAVKYSKPGSQVQVGALSTDKEITIVFVDQGVGIPEDEVAQVFEPFFRSAAKELAQERGAGLGLRFVKTVIERHGGSVSAESTFGEGSRLEPTEEATKSAHRRSLVVCHRRGHSS